MSEREKSDKVDLHEYQQKIIQRLIDKRRQYETQRKRYQEEEKIQERAFRTEWKALHKEKTNEKIASQVDNVILKKSITRHPDVILRLNKKLTGNLVSNNDSLSGLIFPSDSMNLVSESIKEDSFLLTKHHDIVLSNSIIDGDGSEGTKTRKAFQLQTKSTSAVNFLQKTATFNLAINNRIRKTNPETTRRRSYSISNQELSFSSYDKASQANDLMWGLIGNTQFLNPSSTSTPTASSLGIAATPKEVSRRSSCDDMTKIKTVGLMAQFLNDGSNAGTAAAYNWQGADFLSPVQRTQSFINSYLGASKPSSISLGGPTTPGPILPSATPANAEPPTEGHSAMYCSLVDTVFLIGPTKRTIYDYVPIKTSKSVEMTETTKVVVDPSILFMTECDNPAEMLSLLPSYCFPSGVDLTVQPVQVTTPPVTSQRVLLRKTSVTAIAPPAPLTTSKSKSSKKLRPFFPSDFTMTNPSATTTSTVSNTTGTTNTAANSAGAGVTKSNTTANTVTSPPKPTSTTKNAPFVLMFGDHTYQQYCLGLQLPMTFQDMKNDVIIHSTYVVCYMTKLPLFNYLFHILEQFEVLLRGYNFTEPFPVHDENFSIHPDLRLLNEFAARLKKMTVPLFPYLIPSIESYKRTAADSIYAQNPELLTYDDYNAVLPDIEFMFTNRAISNTKIDISFRRSVYQSYFSAISSDYNPFNPEQTRIINAHKTAINKFIPTGTHRSEREKEDTYMILLWALPVLLKYLPLDQIILALGCAVTEMRIVVKHKDFNVISAVILALIYLLKPLRWCSPVIVILPDNLAEFIESPVPIIIGLQKLPDNFVLLERFVVIDPQERIVHLNPTDVVMAHTILLPHAPKLVNVLTAPRETILKLTKRKKNTKLKKTVHLMMPLSPGGTIPVTDDRTIEQAAEQQYPSKFDDATTTNTGRRRQISITTSNVVSGSASPPDPAPILSPQFATPVELDVGTADNTQLLTAVKAFSTLVSNHIEAIINTAIHMQHDEKLRERAKRTVLSGDKPAKAVKQPSQKKIKAVSPPVVDIPAPSTQLPTIIESITPQPSPLRLSVSKSGESLPAGIASPAIVVIEEKLSKSIDTKKPETLFLSKEVLEAATSTMPPISPPLRGESPTGSHSHPINRKRGSSDPGSPNDNLHLPIQGRKSLGHEFPQSARRASPHGDHSPKRSPVHASDPHRKGSPHAFDHAPRKGSPHQESIGLIKSSFTGKGIAEKKSKPATPPFASTIPPKTPSGIQSAKSSPKVVPAVPANRAAKVLDAYETTQKRNKVNIVSRDGHVKKENKDKESARESMKKKTKVGSPKKLTVIAEPMIIPDPPELAPLVPHENCESAIEQHLESPKIKPGSESAKEPPSPQLEKNVINVDRRHTEPINSINLISTISPLSSSSDRTFEAIEKGNTPTIEEDAEEQTISDDPSVASTSSSLPSLRFNAPVLAMKEIGQGGVKFVSQLVETQMYCNYCQNLKVEAASLAAINAERAIIAQTTLGSMSDDNGVLLNLTADGALRELMVPSTPGTKSRGRSLRTRSVSATSLVEDEGEELDAITSVFDVILCGSLPMDLVSVNIAVCNYRELYGEVDYKQSATILNEYKPKLINKVKKMSTSVGYYSSDCQQFVSKDGVNEDNMEYLESIMWCNGLKCRGMCNTPLCTSICLQLWENNVQKLRHQAVLEDIVNKRHHCDLVMKQLKVVDSMNVTRKKNVVSISLKPKLDAIKHRTETESQYQARKAIIKSASFTDKENKPPGKSKRDHPHSAKIITIKGPKIISRSLGGEKPKKCVFACSSTADPATMLIAKYYVEKQGKIMGQRKKKALNIVKRFLLNFVRLYRKLKFFDAVVRVQAFVRGYIIRYYIAHIVEALLARKSSRLLATIRIRRFLRRHADRIMKKRNKVKNAELMKKRAALSLPVRSSSPLLARAATSPPPPEGLAGLRSPTRDTKKVVPTQIIQDGGDGESGFVSLLYSKASKVTSPLRGTRNTTPNRQQGIPGSTSTSEKLNSPDKAPALRPENPRSKSVNFEKPPALSTMETIFGKVDDSKRRDSLKTDTSIIDKLNASYETALKRNSITSIASSEADDSHPDKKYGRRTYSEKAMDFLQFGKILKRNSTGKKKASIFNIASRHSGIFSGQDIGVAGKHEDKERSTLSKIVEVKSTDSMSYEGGASSKSGHNDSMRSLSEKELGEISNITLDSDAPSVRDAPTIVSPTSGIPTYNCEYSSDEDEIKRLRLPKRNSKTFFANKKNSLLARSIINSGFISEAPSESLIMSFTSEVTSSENTEDSKESSKESRVDKDTPSSTEALPKDDSIIKPLPKSRKELLIETRSIPSNQSVDVTPNGLTIELALSVSNDDALVIPISKSSSATPEAATTDSIIPHLSPDKIVGGNVHTSKRRHSTSGAIGNNLSAAFDYKKASPINRYAAQNNYDLSKIVNVSHLESKANNTPPQNALATASRPSPPVVPTPRKMYFQRRSISPKPMLKTRSGSGSGPEGIESLSGDDKSSPESKRNTPPTPPARTVTPVKEGLPPSGLPPKPVTPPEVVRVARLETPEITPSKRKDLHIEVNSSPEAESPVQASTSVVPFTVITSTTSGVSPEKPKANTKTLKFEESDPEESDSESDNEKSSSDEIDDVDVDDRVDDSLSETLKIVPLKTLGKSCLDVLNRQQLQSLKTMWSMLRNGVEMLKHGRNGKPKYKSLFCDVNMTKLYWRSPGSKSDPDQDDSDVEIDTLYPGSVVPKNKHHKLSRRATAFISKTYADRVILFREILEVRSDCSTEVMKRSLAKHYVSGNTCVISIVMDDRTLDFEIDESKWGSIFHALQILVMYYHTISPHRFGSVHGSAHGYSSQDNAPPPNPSSVSREDKGDKRASYPFATISYDSDPPDSPHEGNSYIGVNKFMISANRKKPVRRASVGSNSSNN